MLTIEYVPDGKAFADHEAERYVSEMVRESEDFNIDLTIRTSTENIIYAARVLVREVGYNIQFKFNDKILKPDKNGRLEDWPNGFSDYIDKWLIRLI